MPELPRSLQFLVDQLNQKRDLTPVDMRRLLLDAKVSAEDLEPWADFDYPAEDSYGRKMIHHGPNFEILTMSWRPGSFSMIHDHGHTRWGAVQIFGPAEHATMRIDEDERLITTSRGPVAPGETVAVGHSLIHQMGNPTEDTRFQSLHIYGLRDDVDVVTGDARMFDVENAKIWRGDGGVFFALPDDQIKAIEDGPVGDFSTRLRYQVEAIKRMNWMQDAGITRIDNELKQLTASFFNSAEQQPAMLHRLRLITNSLDKQVNSVQWNTLNQELKAAAKLEKQLKARADVTDPFHKYAEMYDALICQPSMDSFMTGYIDFFAAQHGVDLSEKQVISIGCGTGLVEEHMVKNRGVKPDNMYGMDLSEAMVEEARKRIKADTGDLFDLDPDIRMWDIAYSGLNVYQYIDHKKCADAIQKTADIVRPGGYFLGDFITPDHIRWYPSVMYSSDKQIVSLRTPRLVEENGSMFQYSDITNVNFTDPQMTINYAGEHRRFLPPVVRMRTYFERAFGGKVELYDAVSLKPIPEWADSCESTRYIVVAQKAG